MKSQLFHEVTIKVPAIEFWNVYRGVERSRLVHQLKPDYVGKPEVIEGDGGAGTKVKLGTPTGTTWGETIEVYKLIDDEKRIVELEVAEGGIKLLGFDPCNIRFEIVEKDAETTVVRSTIDFEIDDKLVDNIHRVNMEHFQLAAEIIADYLNEKRQKPSA